MPVFSRSAALICIVLSLITACGSQESANTNILAAAFKTANTNTFSNSSGQTDSGLLQSLAELYPNGQLPASRAAQASQDLSQNPAALKLTAKASTAFKSQNTKNTSITPQAATADFRPVQRVQNTTLYGAYFFSIYPTEVNNALATNPNWHLEGPAFLASLATGTDLYPVHRFRNKTNGSYLYSIYETEFTTIITNYASFFEYEGTAWFARKTPAAGWSALYRFRNKTNGTYLFSAFESEKNEIVANYSAVFAFEGIAYYVRQDAPEYRPPATSSRNVFWLRTDSSRYDYLTSNELIYSEANSYSPIVYTATNALSLSFDTTYPYSIDFLIQPEPGGQLRTGLTKYATRSSIFGASVPRLDVSANGRGCNNSTGAFFVHELGVAADGRVIVFAADFTISCDGGDFANGAVRFNSGISSVLPRVFANAGTDFSVQAGSTIPLVGDLSWSPSSKIRSAQWTQVSGPTLDLSQCAQLNCIAYAPLVPAGGANAVLKLTVESESGLMSSDTVNIAIRE